MPGTQTDIQHIKKLNELDKQIFQAKSILDDSPVKTRIADVREKKEAVKQKRDQIDKVYVTARAALTEMSERDSKIVEDLKRTQAEIDKNSGDYRKVQDASAQLAALQAQREEIDKKLVQHEENFNKIKDLKAQIDTAIGKLSMQEDDLTKRFVSANAVANNKLREATEARSQVQQLIDPEVLRMYAHALERCGERCVSKLEDDGLCSVCRNKLTAAQLSKTSQDGSFSKCPHCGRLLICE